MSKYKLKTDKPFKITYDWQKMWASNVYLYDVFVATIYGKTKDLCSQNVKILTNFLDIKLTS